MRKKHTIFLIILATVAAIDQISKWYVSSVMTLHSSTPVIEGFFNITHIRNPGAAFGFLANAAPLIQSGFLIVVSAAAILMILWFLARERSAGPLLVWALSLIAGGALGNLIDRVRLGGVVDFLDVYIGAYHWPAFNVADSAISVGAIILIVEMFIRRRSAITAAGE